jgi:hypothetical protein
MSTVYLSAGELRTQLGLNVSDLSDSAAEAIIDEAEDHVDSKLGGWPVDPDTGRKIIQTDVETWQWSKLKKATLLIAEQLHGEPGLLSRAAYRRTKGPDFEVEDPLGGGKLARAESVLTDSGLRRLTGRARPGRYTDPDTSPYWPAED